MPNRFTRVPARPVPPLPWLGRALLPLADAFMLMLLSRPSSGSLRTTWVTPATLGLCVISALGGALLAVLVWPRTGAGASLLGVVGSTALVVLVVGSICVAVVGILQRQLP